MTADELVATFLNHVDVGRVDDVRAMLARAPELVNAIGPHPFGAVVRSRFTLPSKPADAIGVGIDFNFCNLPIVGSP